MRRLDPVGWIAIAWLSGCPADPPEQEDPQGEGPGVVEDDDDDDDDGHTVATGDCDDGDPDVHPGADERCDGVDEDCDGAVDEEPIDAVTGFADLDGDGFGAGAGLVSCPAPGMIFVDGDCDDGDPGRFPGAPERCGEVDEDCDAATLVFAEIGGATFLSVEDAVAAAVDGDTVTICAGVHPVRGMRITRPITVAGFGSDPGLTTLDGEDQGAIFVVDGGALTLAGLTLVNGSGVPTPSLGGDRAGGAVNALVGDGGPVTVEGCVLEGNNATYGGAIAASALTIVDSALVENVALEEGGAVYHAGPDPLTIEGSTFSSNIASGGAGVYSRNQATIGASTFEGNQAVFAGGALWFHGRPMMAAELVGTTIESNIGGTYGGGIYAIDTELVLDTTTVVSGNSALEGGGGRLIGPGSWSGGTISGNIASGSGGGIALSVYDGTAVLSGAIVDGNVSGSEGGGISVSAYGEGRIVDTVVTGNTAPAGGGVFAESVSLELVNVELVGNEAEVGAGVEQVGWDVRIVDSTLASNVASSVGGGVHVREGTTAVESCAFGVDATANVPDDVAGGTGPSFTGFGDPATFSCDWNWPTSRLHCE